MGQDVPNPLQSVPMHDPWGFGLVRGPYAWLFAGKVHVDLSLAIDRGYLRESDGNHQGDVREDTILDLVSWALDINFEKNHTIPGPVSLRAWEYGWYRWDGSAEECCDWFERAWERSWTECSSLLTRWERSSYRLSFCICNSSKRLRSSKEHMGFTSPCSPACRTTESRESNGFKASQWSPS